MSKRWIAIMSFSVLLLMTHINTNSAEKFEFRKRITYYDDGRKGTIACIHFPDVQLKQNSSLPNSTTAFRRLLGKENKAHQSLYRKNLKAYSKKLRRAHRKHRHFPDYLPYLPWIPKLPVIPQIGIPPRIRIPLVPPIFPVEVMSKMKNFIPPDIISGDKPISWSYHDGNTSININYNPSQTSQFIKIQKKKSGKAHESEKIDEKLENVEREATTEIR